jgi:ketosteroid isomerase-like protein
MTSTQTTIGTTNSTTTRPARQIEERNLQTIRRVYEAFGRGDVPSILELVAPDVHWEFGTPDHGIPWLREGRGRDHVASFFVAVGENLDFQSFEPLAILAEGEWVVALVRLSAIHKVTNKPLREACEAHIWRFDAEGRIAAMRHGADTASHLAAIKP